MQEIITNNSKMLAIFEYIKNIATTTQPVLITGETGVGKEVIAQAVHRHSSLPGNFVPVNVAGLDDPMFSDTLFGHDRGAFTGADQAREGLVKRAANGTLFLDEIGDLSLSSQIKLLRLLEDGQYFALGSDKPRQVDFRLIVATNKDLWDLQRADFFRKDLNFRIRTHHIDVPPLRKRKDDIPLLVHYFLEDAAIKLDKYKPEITQELLTLLSSYDFPGNIRELRSMIFDAISRHKEGALSTSSFTEYFNRSSQSRPAHPTDRDQDCVFFPTQLPTIKELTDLLVQEALRRTAGTQAAAAKLLGISQQALSKRLLKKKS